MKKNIKLWILLSFFILSMGLTKDDVIKLVQAKISDDLIIKQIESDGSCFALTSDDIIDLKNKGVSDKILDKLISSTCTKSSANSQNNSENPDASLIIRFRDIPKRIAEKPIMPHKLANIFECKVINGYMQDAIPSRLFRIDNKEVYKVDAIIEFGKKSANPPAKPEEWISLKSYQDCDPPPSLGFYSKPCTYINMVYIEPVINIDNLKSGTHELEIIHNYCTQIKFDQIIGNKAYYKTIPKNEFSVFKTKIEMKPGINEICLNVEPASSPLNKERRFSEPFDEHWSKCEEAIRK